MDWFTARVHKLWGIRRKKLAKDWEDNRASTNLREQEFYAKNPSTLDFKRTYRLSEWRTSSDQENLKLGLYVHLKAVSYQIFSLWHGQDRTLASSSRWVPDQELWTDGVVSISRRSYQTTSSEIAELNQKQLLSRPYEMYEWREAVSVVECLSNHVVFLGGELRGSDHPVSGGAEYVNPESKTAYAIFQPGDWLTKCSIISPPNVSDCWLWMPNCDSMKATRSDLRQVKLRQWHNPGKTFFPPSRLNSTRTAPSTWTSPPRISKY